MDLRYPYSGVISQRKWNRFVREVGKTSCDEPAPCFWDATIDGNHVRPGRKGRNLPRLGFQHCMLNGLAFPKNSLRRAFFKECTLKDCWFIGCDLSKSVFDGCTFINCSFTDCCIFTEAKMVGCTLSWCSFRHAYMPDEIRCCLLRECAMSNASFRTTRATGDTFLRCFFSDAQWNDIPAGFPDQCLFIGCEGVNELKGRANEKGHTLACDFLEVNTVDVNNLR